MSTTGKEDQAQLVNFPSWLSWPPRRSVCHSRVWAAAGCLQTCGMMRIMTIAKSVLLFILAAVAEIGGAWLVWQSVREGRAWWWAGIGIIALGLYGFVATLQPDAHFGRILAAYGGVFVAGSLAWGMAFDGFRPDRWDVTGSLICLAGVAVIMFAPRGPVS